MKVIKKFEIKNTSELQTLTNNKSADPSISPACRRTSPRYKKVPEDDAKPAQLRRTPRNTKGIEPSAAVSPCVTTTPKRRRQFESITLSSPPTKREDTRKNNVQFESAQHTVNNVRMFCVYHMVLNVSVYIIWVCEWIFQLH